MAGYFTPGLVATPLPLTGNETIPLDTNLGGGASPQTAKLSVQALTTRGKGAVQVVADGTSPAIDCTLGSYFSLTPAANRTLPAFSNPAPGQEIDVEITQDATGSRLITWNANVSWAAGTAPTLTTTAGATDLLRFTWNATKAKWRGETVGKAYA